MKIFFIASMIVLLYVAYTSIMPVHAQNEVSVQKQNLYNSITVKIFPGERRGRQYPRFSRKHTVICR